LGLILLIGTPFFFLGGPGYYASRSFQAAWDLGHILFFLLLSLWLHGRLREKLAAFSLRTFFFTIFSFVFFTGFLVEILQMFSSNRSPDMEDVLRNQLGCLLAFAFFIRPWLFGEPQVRRLFRAGVVALLAVAIWPLSRSLIDEYLAARHFPLLADFETPFERSRWVNVDQLREETNIVRHGHKSVRVQLSTNKYSGISLFHFPRDWRDYRTLHWSVYNPQEAGLVLNSRIHDIHHRKHVMEFSDRYNQQFILEHGWNDLVIPLNKVKAAPKGRAMDMAHIDGFGLFVVQQPRSQAIYLDHVYLGQ
jgi:VanZ family protein